MGALVVYNNRLTWWNSAISQGSSSVKIPSVFYACCLKHTQINKNTLIYIYEMVLQELDISLNFVSIWGSPWDNGTFM